MAVVPITISWPAVPGSLGYLVEYKERVSPIWITPAVPANPTLSLSYVLNINEGTLYDIRVSSQCNSGKSKYVYTTAFDPLAPTFAWVEDTFTCEQDDPFTLVDTYNGFSSPQGLYWDETLARFYVVDLDDVNGNVWYFNPATFTGFGDQTYAPGTIVPDGGTGNGNLVQSYDHSPSLRKIFMAGPQTSGVIVYNIATGVVSSVNDGGGNGNFARLFCRILNGVLYVTNQEGADQICLINPASETVSSTVLISSIPSGATFFNNSYNLYSVNGEIWACAGSFRATSGDIGRYDATLSTLLGTITIPGAVVATDPGGWLGQFWQAQYHDEEKDRFYLFDVGSGTLTIIDTTTNTVIDQNILTNKEGRRYISGGFSFNSLTGTLYFNRFNTDNVTLTGSTVKFYVLDRDTYEFEAMYVNQSTSGLSLRAGTNEFWAAISGVPRWAVPNTGWDTDGQLFKYST